MERETVTLGLAIYAAALSTVIAVAKGITWLRDRRPRLSGYAVANMEHSAFPGSTYVALKIQNRGNVPVTLNTVWLVHFKSPLHRWRGKYEADAVYIKHTAALGPPLPHLLEKGTEFTSMALQNGALIERARRHQLFFAVPHSMSERPFFVALPKI